MLKSPFPYFGGKSRVALEVWERFGAVKNYVEPFAGSAAMLLGRPRTSVISPNHDHDWGIETINDADGLISNFWRAMRYKPEELIYYANWPVHEADQHARHIWLLNQKKDLAERLMGDPEWCDAKAAGWWLYGICINIGGGYCSGDGPWNTDGKRIVKVDEEGITRCIPHIGDSGNGINRGIPHIGDSGRGINRKIPNSNDTFIGEETVRYHLAPIINRLRRVRICCGDWTRVLGAGVGEYLGTCAVFLDPPYSIGDIDYNAGDRTTTYDVRQWCVDNYRRPHLRIALCGYEGEHNELQDHGWTVLQWQAHGGYGNQIDGQGRKNKTRERIWLSPHCLAEKQTKLF